MGLFSYTNDYSGLRGQAKIDAAVSDAKEYLGAERYSLLVDAMIDKGRTWPEKHGGAKYPFEQFACWCDFAGIRGYPIQAMWDTIFPDRAGDYTDTGTVG